MLDITLVCVPPRSSHHAKKIARVGGFARLVDKPELVAAREMLDTLLLPHQPPAPVPGPVVLCLEFTWPWLASHSRRTRTLGRIPHTSKPDASNVTKTLEDRLVALRFLEDDRAVAALHVLKWWGPAPGIRIVVGPFVAFDAGTIGVAAPPPGVDRLDVFREFLEVR